MKYDDELDCPFCCGPCDLDGPEDADYLALIAVALWIAGIVIGWLARGAA